MQWKPSVTVAAIVEREGRFLVVEEDIDDRVLVNQPAGHLEEGEDLIGAVQRETLEETGWHFEPEGVTGLYLYRTPSGETYLRVCFYGEATHRVSVKELDPDILRVAWYDRSTLEASSQRLRSPLVLRCIDDYLSGARHPLSLLNYLS